MDRVTESPRPDYTFECEEPLVVPPEIVNFRMLAAGTGTAAVNWPETRSAIEYLVSQNLPLAPAPVGLIERCALYRSVQISAACRYR
jgi:hypothetical protein